MSAADARAIEERLGSDAGHCRVLCQHAWTRRLSAGKSVAAECGEAAAHGSVRWCICTQQIQLGLGHICSKQAMADPWLCR